MNKRRSGKTKKVEEEHVGVKSKMQKVSDYAKTVKIESPALIEQLTGAINVPTMGFYKFGMQEENK